MYVVVQHRFTNPQIVFSRGEKLIRNEGAPDGVHGLQFYPSRDGSVATCLWEAPSIESVQRYVDSALGDASENACYEVAAEQAFSQQPSGIQQPTAFRR